MRLSEHFESREFRSHDGKGVPIAYARQLRDLCQVYLEPLRRCYGPVTVISGFRTATHNESVGGAPASFHLKLAGRLGVAADVRCERGSPAQWYRFLEALDPGGLGLYPTHVHIDTRRGRARW